MGNNIVKNYFKYNNINLVEIIKHNNKIYTQGLIFHNNFFYESGGLYGKSKLYKYDNNFNLIDSIKLPDNVFAEGITIFDDKIYVLTWKKKYGFIYNTNLKFIDKFYFNTNTSEGWGLTHNINNLILSDGSSKLYFIDKNTMENKYSLDVKYKGDKINKLNELENINNYIYANIYGKCKIAVINILSGKIKKIHNFYFLKIFERRGVMNGIAYDGKYIYITGKRWNNIYKIKIK